MPWLARLSGAPGRWSTAALAWWRGWWQVILFAAQVLVVALSPSSYRRAQRALIARRMYLAARPLLPIFTVLSALVALVIIRIVLATSLSYGLSRYALDVLVRTLVLELIPLSAVLFVAVRQALPAGAAIRAQRAHGGFKSLLDAGQDPTRDIVLPHALACMFAVITLAAVSSLVTLVLTYLSVYGFHTWGVPGFTRSVGHVFTPVIVLIFTLKTLALSLAVAIIPMVATPRELRGDETRGPAELALLARLLAVVLLIEVVSLLGNYY
jgi:phospholipid/cholesterol/gamma-HCH transport system permease protein